MGMPVQNGPTIIADAALIRQQALEYVVAAGNGRPAHPERIAYACLPLFRRFGDGGRAQKCNQRKGRYRKKYSHRTPRVQFVYCPAFTRVSTCRICRSDKRWRPLLLRYDEAVAAAAGVAFCPD
jgi:hypothetical protein